MAIIAIHPGEQLAEELKPLDMSAAELARKIGVPTNRVTQILNGERSITGDTALRISSAPARNSGSTCKACMSCASRRKSTGKPSSDFPHGSNPSRSARKGQNRRLKTTTSG